MKNRREDRKEYEVQELFLPESGLFAYAAADNPVRKPQSGELSLGRGDDEAPSLTRHRTPIITRQALPK